MWLAQKNALVSLEERCGSSRRTGLAECSKFRRGLGCALCGFDWCPSSERVGVFLFRFPHRGRGKLPPSQVPEGSGTSCGVYKYPLFPGRLSVIPGFPHGASALQFTGMRIQGGGCSPSPGEGLGQRLQWMRPVCLPPPPCAVGSPKPCGEITLSFVPFR